MRLVRGLENVKGADRDRLRRVAIMKRRSAAMEVLKRSSGKLSRGRQYQLKDWYLRGLAASKSIFSASTNSIDHEVPLPAEFGCARVIFRISSPNMPRDGVYAFADHVLDEAGDPTETVLATRTGGFAISEDLGKTWDSVRIPELDRFSVVNARMVSDSRVLLQAIDPFDLLPLPDESIHLIVVERTGKILHRTRLNGARWHGPRAIDISDGTLMYAEYTRNGALRGPTPRKPSRVFRSRDLGCTWDAIREEAGIRHFHLLQARPGTPGEWWLASGDEDSESRIWKSSDDGTSWADQTDSFGPSVHIGDLSLSRRLFRLTDLVWCGKDILWGCDDPLFGAVQRVGGRRASLPGSRVFRGDPASGTPPEILATCGPEIRNIVELPNSYLLLAQGSPFADVYPPRVFLLAEKGRSLVHLFDVGRYSLKHAGFTLSRASRSARNGTFFTYAAPMQLFNSANQILKWEVEFL